MLRFLLLNYIELRSRLDQHPGLRLTLIDLYVQIPSLFVKERQRLASHTLELSHRKRYLPHAKFGNGDFLGSDRLEKSEHSGRVLGLEILLLEFSDYLEVYQESYLFLFLLDCNMIPV